MANPNTAIFPSALPTDETLGGVANDNLYTTLAASINNNQTNNITVSSGSFNIPALILIGTELILVRAKTGNILNNCIRGYAGTTVASHNSGDAVYGYVFAYHRNQDCAEIKAICTALGINLANVIKNAQTAGGDLAGTYPNPTLANVSGLTAGTYGSDVKVPVITVDEKGRVVEVNEVDVTSSGGGGAPTGSAGGDLTGTYPNPTVATVGTKTAAAIAQSVVDTNAATNANNVSTIVKRDSNGDITVRNITATTFIGALTGPVTGNLTGNASGSAATFTGNLTGDVTSVGMTTTLSASGASAGSYGTATQVPAITVDSKGRITAVTNTTIAGVTPAGSAGGDLAGTYPNPTITGCAAGNFAVGNTRLKDNSGVVDFKNSADNAYVKIKALDLELTSNASNVPVCHKYTIDYTQLIDAATDQSVTLVALPAKAKILGITIKSATAFSGSGFTDVSMTIGDGTTHTAYVSSSYDLDAAVSNTNFSDTDLYKSTSFASGNIVARLTANQNFGDATTTALSAGSVEIWVTTIQLP